MSTLEMERGGDLLVRRPAVLPDYVPVDVAAEHPDAASVVAGWPDDRPMTVKVVGRAERRHRAGLVLAFAVCALVAAFAGGGASRAPEPVRVEATTQPAATTVTTAAPAGSQCPPGSSVVAVCEQPACAPAPFSPIGICRPTASGGVTGGGEGR